MRKKYLLLLAILFSIFNFFGQTIPNASFEDWWTRSWFGGPENWMTNNNQQSRPVWKDTNSYDGDFALKINHPLHWNNQGRAWISFPLAIHPYDVSCFIKSSIDGIDTVKIDIYVHSKGKIVDSGHWVSTSSIFPWNRQSIPISQNSYECDTLEIIIQGGFQKETTISVDQFNFDTLIKKITSLEDYKSKKLYSTSNFVTLSDNNINDEIINLEQNKSWNLYPNPTSDFTTLSYNNINNAVHTLKIYNVAGQLVRLIPNIKSDQVIIQKDNLNKGLYFFKLQSSQKIVAAGKLFIH